MQGSFAEIAKVLEYREDETRYEETAEKMKDAIQSCLIGPNGEAPAEYMGAYVLLMYYDLVPEKWIEKFVSRAYSLGGIYDILEDRAGT